MKLTGKLKEKVEEATTEEEAKEAVEEPCMLLTDEEMEMVSGGGLIQIGTGNTPKNPASRLMNEPKSVKLMF